MAITRLGVANPAANTPVSIYAVSYATLASVVVANKSTSTNVLPEVDIYVVPPGASQEAQYAYIVKNLEIQAGQSFETFKFALNASDTLFVKSTTADVSFSVNGIIQADDYSAGDFPTVFTNKTINGNFNTITVEKNSTAARPANAPSGYLRFNTELDKLEVKNNSGTWNVLGTGFGETGPTGPTGPSGGPTGPTGSTGATGSLASINLADLNTLVIDADLASIACAETHTNKTLTNPKINRGLNAQTGTTYTFVLSDNGTIVTANNAGSQTYTIPPSLSASFAIGAEITVIRKGAGSVAFAQGAGVTIRSTGATATAPALRAQYSSATAIYEGSDVWYVIGDIS